MDGSSAGVVCDLFQPWPIRRMHLDTAVAA
jgi:hypothetical protein